MSHLFDRSSGIEPVLRILRVCSHSQTIGASLGPYSSDGAADDAFIDLAAVLAFIRFFR